MKTIHKFKVIPRNHVLMPKDAEILSVGQQGDDIVCWALVDDDAPAHGKRQIIGFGTGHLWGGRPPGIFIGTVQIDNGLVFHFFDFGYANDGGTEHG